MKKAIVVGASSGMGMELARILKLNNYKVGITGRRAELLQKLANEAPEHYVVKIFDVSATINAIAQLDQLVSDLGGLDLFIISAGTGNLNTDLNYEIEAQTNAVNVNGFTAAAGWAFDYFKKQNSGHLVAITSIAGLRGSRHAPAYNASKAYQINYLEGLAQLASNLQLPVYVTDIRPGFVKTAMAKGEGQFWVAEPDRAALQIFKAIEAKKDVAYITKRWRLIAWLFKLFPRSSFKKR